MGLVLGTDMSPEQMAREVARIAAGRQHRLAPYLVDGQHAINPAQYDGIMRHLLGCPEKAADQQMAENFGQARTGADRYFEGRADASAEYRGHLDAARSATVFRETVNDVPAGFFATPSRTGANDLDFWKVTVVKDGPWKGYRKVKRVVGGGDERLPRLIDVSKQEQKLALGAILRTGIARAQEDYADNQERCMKCGRQLTDDVSRARRMGDTCAGKG